MTEPADLALREQFSTPALREQFSNIDQQRESSTLGMWIFIITEMMLFGGLFVAFTVYRLRYRHAFLTGSSEMEFTLGAVNTAVLICSSLTMALAEWYAEQGKGLRCAILLLATAVIGAVFVGIKFFEYYLHFRDHKMPAFGFSASGGLAPQIQLFFVFYFLMTGLHSLHLIIGIGLMLGMFAPAFSGVITAKYHTPIDNAGLYWHFIDVIWVFLYAIFYIPGAHLK